MPTSTGEAAAPEGAVAKPDQTEADAAVAEGNDEGHTVEWHGLKIALPPKLRESIIWRWGTLRTGDVAGNARLIESVIGREQFISVLDKMDEEDMYVNPDAENSPMMDLLELALEQYGLTAGESEASTDS